MMQASRVSHVFGRTALAGIVLCLSGLSLTTLTGCGAVAPIRGPEVVHHYQPDDLPVPLGFELSNDPYESWAEITFAEAPLYIRSGKFTYRGDRPITQVADWYVEQMQQSSEGWKYEGRTDRDDILLEFSKEQERATIAIALIPDPQGQYYMTKVTARIQPR